MSLYYCLCIVYFVTDVEAFFCNWSARICNVCASCNVCCLYLVLCNDVSVYEYFRGTYYS